MVNVNYYKWPNLARLYCHFIKIIKGFGTSVQAPTLSKKHVRNAIHIVH